MILHYNPSNMSSKSPSHYFLHPATLFVIATCIKLLLLPSYKSTDFDVHRNWLALTRQVPIHKWYNDDLQGKTRHTLDYPPLFAWFEYFLTHNFITSHLPRTWLSERCLSQLPDSDNNVDFYTCVVFHRLTVILVGDFVFWIGAWFFSSSCAHFSPSQSTNQIFAFIVLNPGILLLDHVHFQYNGMLLGILLASLACLIQGQANDHTHAINKHHYSFRYDLAGAILFTILLSLKHLYLILAPFYFIYLLRHCCFLPVLHQSQTFVSCYKFSVTRLLILASVTLCTFLIPLWPLINHASKQYPDNTSQYSLGYRYYVSSLEQLQYMFQRLFPFQRGLCHTYWAGNVWAVYLFINKIVTWVQNRIISRRLLQMIRFRSLIPWRISMFHLPIITPTTCALCLFVSLIPGMVCAWHVATRSLLGSISIRDSRDIEHYSTHAQAIISMFLEGVLYSSYSGFMLSYHVHEKAIMTCILPMTLMAFSSHNECMRNRFFRLCVFGHLGLLPLLHQSMETTLKICIYYVFIVWLVEQLSVMIRIPPNLLALVVCSGTLLFTEVIHPILCKLYTPYGTWEFLPLLVTSLVCAVGMIHGWWESTRTLMKSL